MTHRERAEEHAAIARAVFEEAKAPVEPYVEAMLAIYELLLEQAEEREAPFGAEKVPA